MEELNSSAQLYGEYIEKYLHVENELDDDKIVDGNDKKPKSFSYNVSSILSVLMYQVCYIIICPLVGLKEMGSAMWHSLVRDFGGRDNSVHSTS